MVRKALHSLNQLIIGNKSKLVILLSLFLWNCDSGCVPAGSMGSADVTSIDVAANPADILLGDSIRPDLGYNYLAVYDEGGANEMCHSIWRPMNLSYNPNYDYSLGYRGTITSCNQAPSLPSSVEVILTGDMIDGGSMSSLDDGVNISSFKAAFSTSNNYSFTISDPLQGNSFDCLGAKVITYENFGGVEAESNYYTSSSGKDDAVGATASYTCDNNLGCTSNTTFADISGLEIPRGCTVTFYDRKYGHALPSASVTVSVPLSAPNPYAYSLSDYRFDSSGLERNCSDLAIDNCITSLAIIQDPDSYQTCDSNKTSYFWENAMYGDEMHISGPHSTEMVRKVGYTGANPGNDNISSVAVMDGCKLILYDGFANHHATEFVKPRLMDLDSEVFMSELLCKLADKTSWGYEVSLNTMAKDLCTGRDHEYFADNIYSLRIQPNIAYEDLNEMANAFPNRTDYEPQFYNRINSSASNGSLFFDGLSNFMVSNNIADYIRNNSSYTVLLSIEPFCDATDLTEALTDDCNIIGNETESRVIFAANQDNYDDLGDYLSIGPDGILEFNANNLGSTNYYNKKVTIIIKVGVGTADIQILNSDAVTEESFTISIGDTDNNKVVYFSLGQEWDYSNAPSQFYLGSIYNFSLFSNAATDTDISDVASLLAIANTIDTDGGSATGVSGTICHNDFSLNNIQMAFGSNVNTFTVATEDLELDGVFQIPADIKSGDKFFFRIKNSKLLCEDGGSGAAAAFEAYDENSGVITISMTEEQDLAGLMTGLQAYIVDPIVDIFECRDEDCSGFYKMFYEKIVIGTDGNPSLFSVLLNITLQFMVVMMGINFMFGLEKMSSWALFSRVLKIGIVYLLVSPDSWGFFRDNVIVLVRDVPLQIGGFLTDNLLDSDNIAASSQNQYSMFSMLDNITGIFLSSDVHAKIWGLLFTSPTGILMVALLYYTIFIFFKAVIAAMIQYVVIILLISLAIILAPFFIMFALMPFTAQFFGKWLDMLIGCAFKLMLLSLTVVLFSYFIYAYSYNMFNYAVCWKPVLYCCTFLPFQFSLLEFFAPATFDYRRFGIDEVTSSGPDFIKVLSFFIIVILFYKFLDISESISGKLARGTSVAGVAKEFNTSVKSMPKAAANFADNVAGKAYNYAANDPHAYSRMKTNVKRDVYNKTLGKLDNAITGKFTNEQRRAGAALDKAFKNTENEYIRGRGGEDFSKDMTAKARETLKGFNLSDKQVDKVVASDKFKRKLEKGSTKARSKSSGKKE